MPAARQARAGSPGFIVDMTMHAAARQAAAFVILCAVYAVRDLFLARCRVMGSLEGVGLAHDPEADTGLSDKSHAPEKSMAA